VIVAVFVVLHLTDGGSWGATVTDPGGPWRGREGLFNDGMAARLDSPRQIISKWRKRFFDRRLASLEEEPQGGRTNVAMGIDELRYFVAVTNTKSLSQAAIECQLAPPSLSNAVQRLESDLGERLFIRLARASLGSGAVPLRPRRCLGSACRRCWQRCVENSYPFTSHDLSLLRGECSEKHHAFRPCPIRARACTNSRANAVGWVR
jgi:Bacterial regulatory helix-turn-helix protein, lysR family